MTTFSQITIGNGFITAINILFLSVLYIPAICCMLSQSPGIYIVLAAVISGALLMINNLWVTSINNKFKLQPEKQQGIRQQESERQKWYREKIYDSYRTSIQVLTKIVQGRHEIDLGNMAT